MTDSEIIKDLKNLASYTGFNEKRSETLKNTINLIERQQSEIERLNKEVDRLSQDALYHDGQVADAIKEFAEKVHNEIEEAVESNYRVKEERVAKTDDYGDSFVSWVDGKIIALRGIDEYMEELLEKMMGGKDGKIQSNI